MSNEEQTAFDKYLDSLNTETGKFTFEVPAGHSDAGKRIEKTFPFIVCKDTTEAVKVAEGKGWSVLDMVNDNLKANARSNAYQLATAPYRESKRTPEQIREDIIRDYVRSGISEDIARKQVEMLFAAAQS